MKRTRRVNWRLAPAVVEVIERMARETGASASYLANYYLATCVRDRLVDLEKEEEWLGVAPNATE